MRKVVQCCIIGCALLLVGCDKVAEQLAEPRFELQSEAGQIFLVDRTHGDVSSVQAGRIIPLAKGAPPNGPKPPVVKYYTLQLNDFQVFTSVKFRAGKLIYRITVTPKFTDEYSKYLDATLSTPTPQSVAGVKKPLPPEPAKKFKNENWKGILDRAGNRIVVKLLDSDYFKVTDLTLITAQGVNIVDESGQSSSKQFEGEQPIDTADFDAITQSDVNYVLE
jgi:hypothetical protein